MNNAKFYGSSNHNDAAFLIQISQGKKISQTDAEIMPNPSHIPKIWLGIQLKH